LEKYISDLKEGSAKKEVYLSKTISALEDDVASSYIIGFEVVKEQVVI